MTDIEITKACAVAMGLLELPEYSELANGAIYNGATNSVYYPLRKDDQAMALVKKFRLYIDGMLLEDWTVASADTPPNESSCDVDLNRAICLYVAQLK